MAPGGLPRQAALSVMVFLAVVIAVAAGAAPSVSSEPVPPPAVVAQAPATAAPSPSGAPASVASNPAGAQAIPLSGPRGRIRGEVYFSRQEPVSGATVVLYREGDAANILLGATDHDGNFRFEGIPEGAYSLSVLREGAAPATKTGITVNPPARTVVDMALKRDAGRLMAPVFDLARFDKTPPDTQPAAAGPDQGLRVKALATELRPVREARVAIHSRGPRIDPLRGTTDGSGDLLLPSPQPGEYSVQIVMPGYLPVRVDRLVIGKTPLRVFVVLTPRPFATPSLPADLLPDEKSVPPEGFPGSREKSKP